MNEKNKIGEKSKNLKLKGEKLNFSSYFSHVVCALIAAVAASSTLTVHANSTRNWIGGTGTADAPKDLWDTANWDGEGNFGQGNTVNCFLSVTDKTYLNSANSSRFCCDLVPNAGDFVFTGPLQFYCLKQGSVANSTVSIVKKSGDWSVVTYGMYIGNASGTKATFVNESGNITSTGNSYGVHIGCVAGATGIVENVSGDWTISGDLYLAETSDTAATFVNESGNVTVGNINFGTWNAASGTGTLTIKGGTVTLVDGKETKFLHGEGTINLDGGTLVTKRIQRFGQNGSLIQNINFNGGTLKASAADATPFIYSQYGYMYVTVGAGGGTIDCNGFPITLDLNTTTNGTNNGFFKGDGGLTFTGGNTITINSKVTYSGATSVTPGTTLAVTAEDSKNNILSHGLVVAGIPTEAEAGKPVFTYTSALDDADLDNVSCSLAPAATFKFSDEGKTNIVFDVVGSAIENYWTGAVDNDLSNDGNWSSGSMPTDKANIFSTNVVSLTKGARFAPTSITFLAGSQAVTIDGDFTTLTSVTNNSSVNQTFAGFVDFGARDIDVTQAGTYTYFCTTNNTNITEYPSGVSGGCVVFAGGVKGNDIVNHTILSGHYELTKASDFIATTVRDARIVINENSSLSVKNAGDTRELYICDGATFNVADFSNAANRLWTWNKGTLIVTNFTYTGTGYFCLGGWTQSWAGGDANANAVLKAGTLTLNGSGTIGLHGTGANSGYSKSAIFIGEGGVNIASGKAGYYLVKSKTHKTTLRPWNSDFTFGGGSSKDYDFLLGEGADEGNMGDINFTLNTDDEAGVPRTITMAARIKTARDTSSITVAGHGTNIVTSASPDMTGTYAVTDAATVKFTAGAGFTNETSRVSLGAGTTLEYTNSGNTLAFPFSTLVLPSSGKATLRINGGRLRGGDHVIVSGVSEGADSLLDVEPAASVLDGRKYEVKVSGSNLVLNVKSGLILLIR